MRCATTVCHAMSWTHISMHTCVCDTTYTCVCDTTHTCVCDTTCTCVCAYRRITRACELLMTHICVQHDPYHVFLKVSHVSYEGVMSPMSWVMSRINESHVKGVMSHICVYHDPYHMFLTRSVCVYWYIYTHTCMIHTYKCNAYVCVLHTCVLCVSYMCVWCDSSYTITCWRTRRWTCSGTQSWLKCALFIYTHMWCICMYVCNEYMRLSHSYVRDMTHTIHAHTHHRHT